MRIEAALESSDSPIIWKGKNGQSFKMKQMMMISTNNDGQKQRILMQNLQRKIWIPFKWTKEGKKIRTRNTFENGMKKKKEESRICLIRVEKEKASKVLAFINMERTKKSCEILARIAYYNQW